MELIQISKKGLKFVTNAILLKMLRWAIKNMHQLIQDKELYREHENVGELLKAVEKNEKVQMDIHLIEGLETEQVEFYKNAFEKYGLQFSVEFDKDTNSYTVGFNIPYKGSEKAVTEILKNVEKDIIDGNTLPLMNKISIAKRKMIEALEKTPDLMMDEISKKLTERKEERMT